MFVTASHTCTILIRIPVVEVVNLVRVSQQLDGGHCRGKRKLAIGLQRSRKEAVVATTIYEIVVMVETINVSRVARMPQASGWVECGGILQHPVLSGFIISMRQIMVAFFDDMKRVVLRRRVSGKSKEQQATGCQLSQHLININAVFSHFRMIVCCISFCQGFSVLMCHSSILRFSVLKLTATRNSLRGSEAKGRA